MVLGQDSTTSGCAILVLVPSCLVMSNLTLAAYIETSTGTSNNSEAVWNNIKINI